MEIVRTVRTPRPVGDVFAYLADFTTTEEWDPGTVSTTLTSGDGGVGTRYHNISRFLGRQTELDYVVTEHDPPGRLVLRGENRTVVAHDTMTLAAAPDGGTEVTYRARLDVKGWARLAAPVLALAFRRLGDKAASSMRSALAARS